MKRALSAMVRAIGNENKEKKISHIVISHCGQEAGAYEVKKKLNKILPDCQIHIVETGGIASVYAGICINPLMRRQTESVASSVFSSHGIKTFLSFRVSEKTGESQSVPAGSGRNLPSFLM